MNTEYWLKNKYVQTTVLHKGKGKNVTVEQQDSLTVSSIVDKIEFNLETMMGK